MRYVIIVLTIFFFTTSIQWAHAQETKKLEEVEEVLGALIDQPDEGVPRALLEKAEAIVVIPKLKKGGFVIGGKFGKGVAMVRKSNGDWSDPVFVKLAGGSLGFQIGYSSTDLFLIFKDAGTLERLAYGKGQFTIGGDISIAAGPVGRQSSAKTDLDFDAEVYSYSRSRGVFAGLSLDGSELKVDKEANQSYYGEDIPVEKL
ncbi:MAG: lipid-binding SYLF domain-containing protein, partial [Bacteroidota bacterium]